MPNPSQEQPQLFPLEHDNPGVIAQLEQPPATANYETTDRIRQIDPRTEQDSDSIGSSSGLLDKLRSNKTAAVSALGGAVVATILFNMSKGNDEPGIRNTVEASGPADSLDPEATSTQPEGGNTSVSPPTESGAIDPAPVFRDRYESPISGNSAPRETWIQLWRIETDQLAGPSAKETGTLSYVDSTTADLKERVGLESTPENPQARPDTIEIAENVAYLYEYEGRTITIDRPAIYGMHFAPKDDGSFEAQWSWNATHEAYDNYTLLFPLDGDIEQFTVTGEDSDVRWFTQEGARLLGLFYTDGSEEARLSQVVANTDESYLRRESISNQTPRLDLGVAETSEHATIWDAWDSLETKYPQLVPVELSEISNFAK
ncbi:MAG: hypothetical protein WD467_02030 [Candidatus Saccharimonadales bacterium]